MDSFGVASVGTFHVAWARKYLPWAVGALAALGAVALAYVGWVHWASEAHLRSFARPPEFTRAIPTDAAALTRGAHLVRTRGCRGCHGSDLAGELMWGYAVAPNLPRFARSQSPAVFEAAVRHGVGADGRALYSMPAYNFIRLTDDDMAAIIAYLRTAPIAEKKLPRSKLPWSVRREIAAGKDWAVPAYIDRVPQLRRGGDPDARIARGEYIAMTTCNECHGLSLRADYPWKDDRPAPDLVILFGGRVPPPHENGEGDGRT
jgi:mono/diheme cytochrome c family protein